MSAKSRPKTGTAVIVVLAGLIILLIAGVFARQYTQSIQGSRPIPRSSDITAIAGWMTPHYIARAYSVPESVVLSAVGVSAQEARHQSLNSIAKSQHKRPEEVIAAVRTAILQYKATAPTPTVAPGAFRWLIQMEST